MNRVIIMVLDSVGIGSLPDAHVYGDEMCNTVGHISKLLNGLSIPNLVSLGFGNIDGIEGVNSTTSPKGNFGRLMEKSNGKDTTTGHFEIAGVIVEENFPTYPNGFDKEIIEEFESLTGRRVIGNIVASGTDIIRDLGQKHVETGDLIVYTSADSVFQIAAHEDVVPLEELYKICNIARGILRGKHNVSRVIARPFIGEEGSFKRTPNRRDFSVKPPRKTMLDYISDESLDVIGIGKISDIYAGCGITKSYHAKSNKENVQKTIELINEKSTGLIFSNLVDFDMLYGHRNDPEGYKAALEEFDVMLKDVLDSMKVEDILILTADHGCDPTTKGTDHTREYTPLLVYGSSIKGGVNIGTRDSFADIGKTVLDILNINNDIDGNSFKDKIIK
ncbi:MAG: phosphopentomutase [Clostridium sp.]|uniref:phosphopentomutase n=1 Tax=Clostridium sp. TaxID=1506 RepID=UPI002FC8C329